MVYRYAPDRETPKWRWVMWGSVIAATLWILGSLVFALYVQNFGSYGETYGALGGVIVLLMWFYQLGFTIVLGAEINAEMEHQTSVDTTEGPPAPMGQRGAYVADTVGRSSKEGALDFHEFAPMAICCSALKPLSVHPVSGPHTDPA